MGYKTKSMIYAKSLKFDKDNSWIMKGATGKKAVAEDNFFNGTGAKILPEIKEDPQFNVNEKKESNTKKETGAYKAGAVLLDKTGQEVGKDVGVLNGLTSENEGTRLGTSLGIMVNKMDKSPRSTAKFDSKIKEAQGRGNLAKAARLEKREAGYAYRQEKRATRIDPTYKGKTDNTIAKKLEAGKTRRASTAAAAKPETKPVISEARKKASNKYFAGESDRATKATKATKAATTTATTTATKGATKGATKATKGATPTGSTGNAATRHSLTKKPGSPTGKQGPDNVKPRSNSVGKNTVLRNSDAYKPPKTYSQKMKDLSKYKGIGTGKNPKPTGKNSKPKPNSTQNNLARSKNQLKTAVNTFGKYLDPNKNFTKLNRYLTTGQPYK